MKNIFILLILTSLSSLAASTNVDYAALPGIIANEDMFGMVLSAETNSLKSGVWIDNTNHTIVIQNGEVVGRVAASMLNMSTNKINFWEHWPRDLDYKIKLIDSKGNEVQKTAYGKKFGRPPKQNPDGININPNNINPYWHDPRTYGLRGWAVLPRGDILNESSDHNPVKSLPKCFEIRKPGNYKFTLIHHIYVTEQRTNGLFLKPITFSPVTVDVRVESVGK